MRATCTAHLSLLDLICLQIHSEETVEARHCVIFYGHVLSHPVIPLKFRIHRNQHVNYGLAFTFLDVQC
jgi:hypothetical protein